MKRGSLGIPRARATLIRAKAGPKGLANQPLCLAWSRRGPRGIPGGPLVSRRRRWWRSSGQAVVSAIFSIASSASSLARARRPGLAPVSCHEFILTRMFAIPRPSEWLEPGAPSELTPRVGPANLDRRSNVQRHTWAPAGLPKVVEGGPPYAAYSPDDEKSTAHGWMFRVGTPETASQPAVIYFAVGKNNLQEAMAAALDHPDIEPGDEVAWADRLI